MNPDELVWISAAMMFGALLVLNVACCARRTPPGVRFGITQGRRYVMVAFAQAVAVVAVLLPLQQTGVDETFRALDLFGGLGRLGMAVRLSFLAGICSPLLSGLSVLLIRRYPTPPLGSAPLA